MIGGLPIVGEQGLAAIIDPLKGFLHRGIEISSDGVTHGGVWWVDWMGKRQPENHLGQAFSPI
jgi:hypothetical protein